MNNLTIILGLILLLILFLIWCKCFGFEFFGETIGLGGTTGAEREDRADIYSSGATLRNVAPLFSATNQDNERSY